MKKLFVCLLICLLAVCCLTKINQDKYPLVRIGMLTLELSDTMLSNLKRKIKNKMNMDFKIDFEVPQKMNEIEEIVNEEKISMISTAYIKNLRQFKNVKVIPVSVHKSNEEIFEIFKSLDGFFLTGGSSNIMTQNEKTGLFSKLTEFGAKTTAIITEVKRINREERVFPLFGTCLGFQAMLAEAGGDEFSMDQFDDLKNFHAQLNVLSEENSSLISTEEYDFSINSNFHPKIEEIESFEDFNIKNFYQLDHRVDRIFYFYHKFGLQVYSFLKNDNLMNEYNITGISSVTNFVYDLLSNNLIRESLETQRFDKFTFISSMEHKIYPIFGTQYHPEKPLYKDPVLDLELVTRRMMFFNNKFSKYFVNNVRFAKIMNRKNEIHTKPLVEELMSRRKFKTFDILGFEEINIY